MARIVSLGGVPVRDTTTRALLRFLDRRPARPLAIGFVNHNFVVACQALRPQAAADPDGILLLNDGVGVALAARLVAGRGFAENTNGTDFVPRLLFEVDRDLSVYLLGGTPEVVARASAFVDAMPRRRVVGATDGFSIWQDEARVVAAINAARPDILLVGFGNPRQERWILDNRRQLDVGVILAVGALFEWMTGSRRRAPQILQRARLEWLYRLAIEPRRLFKRYTIDVLRFFALVLRERGTATTVSRDRAPPR